MLPGPTKSRGVVDFVAAPAVGGASFDKYQTEFFQKIRPTSLLKRFAEPEEIALFVTYLASPLASAITGAALSSTAASSKAPSEASAGAVRGCYNLYTFL